MNPRKEKDNSLLFCVAEDSEHSKKCRSFSLGPLGLLSCNLRVSFSRLGLNMVCVFWGGTAVFVYSLLYGKPCFSIFRSWPTVRGLDSCGFVWIALCGLLFVVILC